MPTYCCALLAAAKAAALLLHGRLQNGLVQGELCDELQKICALLCKLHGVNPAHMPPYSITLQHEIATWRRV